MANSVAHFEIIQLSFDSDDVEGFYDAREANGVTFSMPPAPLHGTTMARFLDCEGAETSVGQTPK